jgi:poly-gamma-glutamate capsule biosynthesis protein CapA/YwtB (metallophosphatase superfamily)
MMSDGSAQIFVVGDVFPNIGDDDVSFARVAPLLRTADVVAGNCEGVYSNNPSRSPTRKHTMVASLSRGRRLSEVPFHVLSCANNHAMDGGYAGLAECIEMLRSQGILVVGAGSNLAEATEPAIVVRNGVRIAFLAFCSVFPVGYEARESRPGIAAVRVLTHYSQPDPNFWEPGIAPRISTEVFPADREIFEGAIAAARRRADVVVVLGHWGYSSSVETILPYEKEIARAAVDAGADAVICCHHHSLRPIEVRNGRPIFYGMGALVHHMEVDDEVRRSRAAQGRIIAESDEYRYFPFHRDARMTGIATLEVSASGVLRAGFVPAQILPDGSTEPLRHDEPQAKVVNDYLRRITTEGGFMTRFVDDRRAEWSCLYAELT